MNQAAESSEAPGTNGQAQEGEWEEDPNAKEDEPDAAEGPSPEEIKTVTGGTIYKSAVRFEELPISDQLLQGLYTEMRFQRPSSIQAVTLPMVLAPPYKGLIAQAHNGSGKTTCFVLAMLSRVDAMIGRPQALCVCPTRELVVQNVDVLRRMSKHTAITALSTAVSDIEMPYTRGQRISQHVVIGTHGKLKSWMSKKFLELAALKILVLDEADEMLKQDGFASDSVRMINNIRKEVPIIQILLFSATFSDKVKAFAIKVVGANANQVVGKVLGEAAESGGQHCLNLASYKIGMPTAGCLINACSGIVVQVFVPKEELSLEAIKQYKVICEPVKQKLDVLQHFIMPLALKAGQTIIFVRTRETARQLHAQLMADGWKCTAISGEMEMSVRDTVVNEFREGKTSVLITTDVLSRGFDVQQVNLVINFNIPTERDHETPAYETYLHRIGRSGRFGRSGAAFNLLSGSTETLVMRKIEDYFQHQVQELAADDEDQFEQALVDAGLRRGDSDD